MNNTIYVKKIELFNYWNKKSLGEWPQIFVNGKALGDIINELSENSIYYDAKLLKQTFEYDLDSEYCDLFIKWLLDNKQDGYIPILLCDGDTDFSCLTIAIKTRFDSDCIYWDDAVIVEPFDVFAYSDYGIIYHEAYSEEDWDKYGTNIALADKGSDDYKEWVSENFTEEMFRRLKNAYYPFLNDEKSHKPIGKLGLCFNIEEYNNMLEAIKIKE